MLDRGIKAEQKLRKIEEQTLQNDAHELEKNLLQSKMKEARKRHERVHNKEPAKLSKHRNTYNPTPYNHKM